MEVPRWIGRAAPVGALALLAAAGLPRPPAMAATDPPWHPPACGPARVADPAAETWFRLDGRLESGTLAGRRLVTARLGQRARSLDLPPESFATGPTDGVLVVGADDGRRTRLSLLDLRAGCERVIGEEVAVVRSALLEPGGGTLVEHRVDRATRADLGIWRRPLDGTPAHRLLPGLDDAPPYGRTFTTELRVDADGRLAVTSCGELACRTRVVDPRGSVTTFGPTGPVLGVTPDGVVARGRCPGEPCAILALDGGGGVRMLVPSAGRAAMAGGRVVYEDGDGLSMVDADGRHATRLTGSSGLVPLDRGSLAASGADTAPDRVLLATGGRMDGHAATVGRGDARAVALGEVNR